MRYLVVVGEKDDIKIVQLGPRESVYSTIREKYIRDDLELVTISDLPVRKFTFVVDESGKLKGKMFNSTILCSFDRVLVGRVVVCKVGKNNLIGLTIKEVEEIVSALYSAKRIEWIKK